MLKVRVIPTLTFNGFALVKTKQFGNPRMVGNPIQSAKVFNFRNVDELLFIDIFATKQRRKLNLKVVEKVINECFMPVSIGGGIQSLEDIHNLLNIGADKVVIKTQAIREPNFIKEAVKVFGAQAIVIAVDIRKENGRLWLHHFDPSYSKIDALEFAKKMENFGAGEFVVADVNNDGQMKGFDNDIFTQIRDAVSLPIIASGGAGKPEHFSNLINEVPVTGISGASIFYFTQYTPFDIKYQLAKHEHPVRIFDQHLSSGVNR